MVIFINGSMNSGKSTLAKVLVQKIPNTAHIEIDSLRHFINWMPLDQSIPLNLENAVLLIKNFVKNGLNAVVTYPLSQKNYDFVIENLNNLNDKIYFFTLSPKLKIVVQDRGERKLDEKEKERIKYHYEIGINNPTFGKILDTTNHTPDQTAQEIIELIKK